MSYDLAVWDGERPADDAAAGVVFEQLPSRRPTPEERVGG
jgi:hypothetical protein